MIETKTETVLENGLGFCYVEIANFSLAASGRGQFVHSAVVTVTPLGMLGSLHRNSNFSLACRQTPLLEGRRPVGTLGGGVFFAILTPQSASLTAACGRPGRGSASPPDWHSLPRLRFAYPSRGAVICCSHNKCQFDIQPSYRVGPMAYRYLPAKQSEIINFKEFMNFAAFCCA